MYKIKIRDTFANIEVRNLNCSGLLDFMQKNIIYFEVELLEIYLNCIGNNDFLIFRVNTEKHTFINLSDMPIVHKSIINYLLKLERQMIKRGYIYE